MGYEHFYTGRNPLTSKGVDISSIDNIEWYNEQLARIGKKGYTYKGTRLTGDHYWFLNFVPISLKHRLPNGKVIDELGFPLFCQTDDWLFK